MQETAVEGGRLAGDAVAATLHSLLVDGLTGVGLDASGVPAPGPVPDWTAIVRVVNGEVRFDVVAQSDLYHLAVEAAVKPQYTQIGDADGIAARVREVLAASTVDDAYNKEQAEAFTHLLATTVAAYWAGSTEALRTAGRSAFDTLMSDDPLPVATVNNSLNELYRRAILNRSYPHWPAAETTEQLLKTRLGVMGVVANVPTLTAIFGTNTARAKTMLPGTDFGLARAPGGQIANAKASLSVPSGCGINAAVLISVTTLAVDPVIADHAIHAPWANCRPTVGVKSTEPDALTALAYVDPATGDRIDYDSATTTDGWSYAAVPHLSDHEDSERGVAAAIAHAAGRFLSARADDPNCGPPTEIELRGGGWLTCSSRGADGFIDVSSTYNLGTCATIRETSGRPFTVGHAVTGKGLVARWIDDSTAETLVCTGSVVTVRIAPDEQRDFAVVHHGGLTVLHSVVGIVVEALPELWQHRLSLGPALAKTTYECVLRNGTIPKGNSDLVGLAETVYSCLNIVLQSADYRELVKVPIEARGVSPSGKVAPTGIKKWVATGVKVAKFAGRALVVLEGGYVGRDYLVSADLYAKGLRPAKPSVDRYNRPIPSSCPITWTSATRKWTYSQPCSDSYYKTPTSQPVGGTRSGGAGYSFPVLLKRAGSTASYVLTPDGTARHVADGNTYICNKKKMPTIFYVTDVEWARWVRTIGPDATCLAGEDRRLVNPALEGYLLVNEDRSRGWLVKGNYRQPLWNFDCMAKRGYLVWDLVTAAEMNAPGFPPPHPSIAATGCTG